MNIDVTTNNVSVTSCIVMEKKCFAVKKGLRRNYFQHVLLIGEKLITNWPRCEHVTADSQSCNACVTSVFCP